MDELRERQERVRATRNLARSELLVGFATPVLGLFLWIAAPGNMGGRRSESGSWLYDVAPDAVVVAGIAGVILGLVIMVRIYRADPEPGEPTWRYRRF